ncbi:MAG: hypothetical protein M0R23_10670 [Bacteroidales bacterium]|jgi:hypothetical protein|nr:hypothetical protein [Bacteroidales bacterium]
MKLSLIKIKELVEESNDETAQIEYITLILMLKELEFILKKYKGILDKPIYKKNKE